MSASIRDITSSISHGIESTNVRFGLPPVHVASQDEILLCIPYFCIALVYYESRLHSPIPKILSVT